MFLSSQLPLGLDFIEILIHMFNFFILITGLSLLIYKPVKNFMAKREEEYRIIAETSQNNEQDALDLKEKYEDLLNKAKHEAVLISEQAEIAAKEQKQEIIDTAKAQASKIIEKAQKEMLEEKEKFKKELVYTVSELSLEIAKKILEREIKQEDNDVIINSVIDSWKD